MGGGKPAARQGDMTRTTTTTTASTAWCSTRGYSTANHRWRAGTSMTRWAAGRENGYGGGSVT